MSIEDKREKIRALTAQIEARKTAHSIATTEANDAVREVRLDREIERLEAELNALDGVPEPTADLSAPQDLGSPVEINIPDDATLAALRTEAKSHGVTGTSRMNSDELIDAIKASTNNEGSEG